MIRAYAGKQIVLGQVLNYDIDGYQTINKGLLLNESPYTLLVAGVGTDTFRVPAFYRDRIDFGQGFDGHMQITPTADIAFAGDPPVSMIYFTGYGFKTDIPTGLTGPVVRLANIGNDVPINASATSIANDGNATNTEFIEATPSGGVKSVSITNNGDARFRDKVVVGKLSTGAAPFANNLTLAQNNGSGCNILADNPPGVAVTYSGFAWDGAAYRQGFALRTDGGFLANYLTFPNLGAFLKQCGKFTGSATGNYSTGCTTTVTVVLAMQSVAGSQTMGWDTPTGSGTVHITSASGQGFAALAFVT